MIDPSVIQRLRAIEDGQVVRFRIGEHTNGDSPDWEPWGQYPIAIQKRTQALRGKKHGSFGEKGAVIWMHFKGCCADFGECSIAGYENDILTVDAEHIIVELELPQ